MKISQNSGFSSPDSRATDEEDEPKHTERADGFHQVIGRRTRKVCM